MDRNKSQPIGHRKPQRKIIHVDCDCFYAAVEIRENPKLQGAAVAVGGSPEKRGVISTCNYEARDYGVRSAMASAYARRLCPHLIILPPRFELYRKVSQQLRTLFSDYTDQIEPLSLDEAFLDVSTSDCCRGSATLMAQEIRRRARELTGITVSAGVAPNKFLAKIASDWHKPDGMKVITPDEVDDFVSALPVRKLFGVGKTTADKLAKLGIENCTELREWDQLELVRHFGSFGERLYELCRGIDLRPVINNQRRKSLSVEHTYDIDIPDQNSLLKRLPTLLAELEERYQTIRHEYAITKRFVKVKFIDFTQTTMEELCALSDKDPFNEKAFSRLIKTAWEREKKTCSLVGSRHSSL